MFVRIVSCGINQHRAAGRVDRKPVSLLVTVTKRAGQQVIEPVEGAQRATTHRLEMVDICTLVVPAVHTTLMAGRHLAERDLDGAVHSAPHRPVKP